MKILFLCSQNKRRSLTAEKYFDGYNGHQVRSAGTENNSRIKVTEGIIGWADMIFCMEKKHLSMAMKALSILSMNLKNIAEDMGVGAYEEHWKALSSVKGIYLIVDTSDAKQYIGSAFGEKGILGRWIEYVNSHHGGNKELIKLLEHHPERYKKFRFTILKIFSEGASVKEVTDAEQLYKAKLGTIEFGLNDN